MQVNPILSYNKYYYATYSLGNVGRHRLDSPGQHEIKGIIHFILPDQSGKFTVTATCCFVLRFQRQSDDDRKRICARRKAIQWRWSAFSPLFAVLYLFDEWKNLEQKRDKSVAVIGPVILNLTRGIIFARVGLILEFHAWQMTGPVCLGKRRIVDHCTTDHVRVFKCQFVLVDWDEISHVSPFLYTSMDNGTYLPCR